MIKWIRIGLVKAATIIIKTKITGIKVLPFDLSDWSEAKERSSFEMSPGWSTSNVYWNGACVCTSLQSVGGQHVEINILYVIYLLLMFLFFLHHHAVIVPVYVSPPSGNSLSRRAEVTAAATINPTYILTTSLPAIFAGMPDCLLVPECVNAHVCAWCTHTHTSRPPMWFSIPKSVSIHWLSD